MEVEVGPVLLARKLGKRGKKKLELELELLPNMDRCILESGESREVLGSTEVSLCRLVVILGRGSDIVRMSEGEGLLAVAVAGGVDLWFVAELVVAAEEMEKRCLGGWSSMEVEVAGSWLRV